jgi:hypothetical protein
VESPRGARLSAASPARLSFDDLDLTLGDGNGVTIDLDHDGQPIGEFVYCELNDDRLAGVGVIDGLALDEIERSVYLSDQYEMVGNGVPAATQRR